MVAKNGIITIKKVTADDLPAVTFVHVTAWKEAYRGQIDQDYLDSLSYESRLSRWQEGFVRRQADPDYALYLALVDNEPAGFIACGSPRDEDMTGYGEILAVYLLQRFYGRNIGHALFQHAVEHHFTDKDRLYLWVLKTNERAQAAYKKWGGQIDFAALKQQVIGTQTVDECRVIFKIK